MADSLDVFISGEWKAYCDVCGKELHASKLRKRWDGFMVCDSDFETRNPQDFVRAITESIVPPWTRPTDGAAFSNLVTIQTIGNTDPPSADLAAVDVYIDTTAGNIDWFLPKAGAGGFFGQQVIYTLNNYAGTHIITAKPSVFGTSDSILGVTTIGAGLTGKFTNTTPKTWKRVS
jgi:hypothetical protein